MIMLHRKLGNILYGGRLLAGAGRNFGKLLRFRIRTVARRSRWHLRRFGVLKEIILGFPRSLFPRERISGVLQFFPSISIGLSERNSFWLIIKQSSESTLTSDTGNRGDLGGIHFPKLQSPNLSRSGRLSDGGTRARKTRGSMGFIILHFLGLRSLGEIRGYDLQESLHFVSISGGNNLEVVRVPPFLWI